MRAPDNNEAPQKANESSRSPSLAQTTRRRFLSWLLPVVATRIMIGFVPSKFNGEPLTNLWAMWVAKHHQKGWPSGGLQLRLVCRELLGELQDSRYTIPPQYKDQREDLLVRSMEPLEGQMSDKNIMGLSLWASHTW